jgi:primosomal replication protein N
LSDNRVSLAGTLVARDALRFTPAGVAVVNFRVAHRSQQIEAGAERRVELEIACIATDETARAIAAAMPGVGLELGGFLAQKGRSSSQLVLHVARLMFREELGNAPTTQR